MNVEFQSIKFVCCAFTSSLFMKETTDLIGILLALVIQLSISAACFIGFSILRPLNLLVYEPRTVYAEKKPQKLGSRFFAWLKPILLFKELKGMDDIGLDAIMFLRFVLLGFKFFTAATVASLLLIAIHIYAPNITKMDFVDVEEQLANPALTLLSITNVPKGSLVFYAHAILAYSYSFWAYYLLFHAWEEYIILRQKYFASPSYANQDHNRTLLITYIPDSMRSNEQVYDLVSKLEFQPTQIFFGRDYMSLPKWIELHRQKTAEFERLIHNCNLY
jgi:calcium permeable stress-gated cation channel